MLGFRTELLHGAVEDSYEKNRDFHQYLVVETIDYMGSYNVQVRQEIMRFLLRDICIAWSLLTSSGARPSVRLSVRHVGVLVDVSC